MRIQVFFFLVIICWLSTEGDCRRRFSRGASVKGKAFSSVGGGIAKGVQSLLYGEEEE